MQEVSVARLYVMRAAYAFVGVGLAVMIWPRLIDVPADLEHMRGVVRAMLGAVSLLAFIGLRHPMLMLPLLLFEFVWKAIWIVAIGIPAWSSGAMGPGQAQTWFDNMVGLAVMLIAIPWGYVWRRYVRAAGDGWSTRSAPSAITA